MTVVTCMNATITYVPPLLVFLRSNMKTELLEVFHQFQWQLVTKLDGSRKGVFCNGSNILSVL